MVSAIHQPSPIVKVTVYEADGSVWRGQKCGDVKCGDWKQYSNCGFLRKRGVFDGKEVGFWETYYTPEGGWANLLSSSTEKKGFLYWIKAKLAEAFLTAHIYEVRYYAPGANFIDCRKHDQRGNVTSFGHLDRRMGLPIGRWEIQNSLGLTDYITYSEKNPGLPLKANINCGGGVHIMEEQDICSRKIKSLKYRILGGEMDLIERQVKVEDEVFKETFENNERQSYSFSIAGRIVEFVRCQGSFVHSLKMFNKNGNVFISTPGTALPSALSKLHQKWHDPKRQLERVQMKRMFGKERRQAFVRVLRDGKTLS